MSKIKNWFDHKEYMEEYNLNDIQCVRSNGLYVSEMITFRDYAGQGIGYGIINNAYNATRHINDYGSLFESVYGFCSTYRAEGENEYEYDEDEYEYDEYDEIEYGE